MAAEPPSSVAPATAANTKRTANRKPKTKSAGPSVLNPNWAQLQSKLSASTFLGKRKHRPAPSPPPHPSPDTEAVELTIKLEPTSDDTSLTKVLALDCEMVGVGAGGSKSALARVTLFDSQIAINWSTTEGFLSIFKSGFFDEDLTRMVNSFGNIVYDEYVRPMEIIVDYRTHISGIRPKHMNKAKEFVIVQKDVAELITGRVLVGHALHHDLKVLLLGHPKKDIRDTSEYKAFRWEGKRRSLKDLAAQELSVNIQQQEHCPIEDARAAMFIYKKHKKGWERNRKDQFRYKNKLKKRGNKKSAEGNEKDPNVTTVLL